MSSYNRLEEIKFEEWRERVQGAVDSIPRTAMHMDAAAVLRDMADVLAEPPCMKCENGMIEYLVEGSESKTEEGFCTCQTGRERKAEHDDALEAKGEARGRGRDQ